MSTNRTIHVKTPGATIIESTDTAVQSLQPGPDLADFIAREVAKGVAAAMATKADALIVAMPENLPDQSTVDPSMIDKMVLTKQGYVVPKDMGQFANQDIVRK
jgi:hypothetical protein